MSAERIRDELTKLMLARPRSRSAGIELLVDTGIAHVVLPEVPRLRLETDEHNRHKDVYQHSLTVLEQSVGLEARYGLRPDLVVRVAALLHDIGKPKTRSRLPAAGSPSIITRRSAPGHGPVPAEGAAVPAAVVADVTTLIALSRTPNACKSHSASIFRCTQFFSPYFLRNFSTRPAESRNFCFPVKKGWQFEQIST